jgi:hypothetical protein
VFSFPWGAGASVALLIVLGPCIEVKTVEGDALDPDADLGDEWADLGIEPVAVHAEVVRRIAQANEPRQQERTGSRHANSSE